MSSFKAIRVHQVERATHSQLETLTLNDLSAGEVVIRVAWSGLNYKDALAVSGKGRIIKSFPRNAGIDLSGEVVSSDAADFKPGDKVLVTGCGIGESLDGGLSEMARVPASAVVKLPAGATTTSTPTWGRFWSAAPPAALAASPSTCSAVKASKCTP